MQEERTPWLTQTEGRDGIMDDIKEITSYTMSEHIRNVWMYYCLFHPHVLSPVMLPCLPCYETTQRPQQCLFKDERNQTQLKNGDDGIWTQDLLQTQDVPIVLSSKDNYLGYSVHFRNGRPCFNLAEFPTFCLMCWLKYRPHPPVRQKLNQNQSA